MKSENSDLETKLKVLEGCEQERKNLQDLILSKERKIEDLEVQTSDISVLKDKAESEIKKITQ